MLRLFVAIALPADIKQWLAAMQGTLRKMGIAVRWVRPEGMHLTVKFLGDAAASQIDPIGQVLAAAVETTAAFALSARGLGVFPGLRNARVMWSGLADGRGAVLALQREVDTRLAPLGFPPECRPFHGHLTLGRAIAPPDPRRLAQAMEKFAAEGSPPFEVGALTLFRSERMPGGARHTVLQEIALGGRSRRDPPPAV
jgi:2'-5' RNA ligase